VWGRVENEGSNFRLCAHLALRVGKMMKGSGENDVYDIIDS
jgi:hypothetical protein